MLKVTLPEYVVTFTNWLLTAFIFLFKKYLEECLALEFEA